MIPTNFTRPQTGFALLITIVIISVVLAVGISLLEITVKQISLSTTARDSEVAFHGAQAAVECAQDALRDINVVLASVPDPLTIDCFASSTTTIPTVTNAAVGPGETTNIEFQFDWSNGEQALCSESDVYIIDARPGTSQENFTDQGLSDVTCNDGDICTVVFSRGFNRGCSDLTSLRTVQREITISF